MKTKLQGFLERSVVGVPRRTAVFLAVLTAALSGFGLCSVASARAADGQQLCSGYAACAVGQFTTNGYQHNENVSWWRMYAGDNCTNYVAYVESQVFGVSEPSYLLGNAYQWGPNAAANGVPVNGTPTVGSVALWGSDAPGMGGDGHVGIVEAIGPDNSYIDVSQSGMGSSDDGYDWEQIYPTRDSWESWPSGFIHFPGTNIPQPPPPPPPPWPAVPASGLSWTPGSVGSVGTPLELPALG